MGHSPLGLSTTQDGTTIAPAAFTVAPGRRQPLRFRVLGEDGKALRAGFEVEARAAPAPDRRPPRPDRLPAPAPGDGRRRHLERAADGCPQAGAYRVFADFQRGGQKHVLAADLLVAGRVPPGRAARPGADRDRRRLRASGSQRPRCTRAGEAALRFTVSRGGRPVARRPAVPRAPRPPRGAARGRPRLPARPPRGARGRRRRDPFAADFPRRAATGCSCSSSIDGRRAHRRLHRRGGTDERAARRDQRLELPIDGMTCASCADRIEQQARTGSTASRPRSTTPPSRRASRFDPARVDARRARRGGRGGRLRRALPARRRGAPRRPPSARPDRARCASA